MSIYDHRFKLRLIKRTLLKWRGFSCGMSYTDSELSVLNFITEEI